MTQAGPPDAHAAGRPLVPLGYASPSLDRRGFNWIALIVAAAVVVRLAYSMTRPADMFSLWALPDQLEYAMGGQALLDGRGLVIDSDPLGYDQKLYAFRMPGYPAFVAACGASLRVVRAMQALLDGASVYAIYSIARRLWLGRPANGDAGRRTGATVAQRASTVTADPRVALLAAAAVAFNPYLIYFSSLILSETLFTAMLTCGIALLLTPRASVRAAGVALLLLTVFVRPSAIGLGIAMATLAFLRPPGRPPAIGRMAVAGLVSAAALTVLLLPWALRNRSVLGRSVWTTTNSGYTAYDSFNPWADGSSNQAVFRGNSSVFYDSASPLSWPVNASPSPSTTPFADWKMQRELGEIGRSDRLSTMAWDYARTHPRRVAELAFAKLGRFWSPVPLSQDFGRPLYVVVGGLYAVPLFVLAAIGVWRGGLGRRATLVLLMPAVYFSLVHCVFVGSLRYRVPCDVPLAVLAAAGAVSFFRPKAGMT